MYRHYDKLWKQSLGSYREMSIAMFEDEALRKFLNQPGIDAEPKCGKKAKPPVENFAREWLELFQVTCNESRCFCVFSAVWR